MKKKLTILTLLFSVVIYVACNSTDNKAVQTQEQSTEAPKDSSDESCSNETTIKDPNNAKPMALMMRQLAANADSMKAKLMRGEKVTYEQYPLIRFHLAEPTDPNVLQPQFYENARLFQEAYQELFKHEKEQVKYHNLVINKCVNCHESYCSGPLKRIRKLYIQ